MQKRILVVDDDRNIGQILHASFSAKGYETYVARNGEDALNTFSETAPDLVLLDVLLPKKNGWEVCKQIKTTDQGKKTHVILMSAIYKNYKMQTDAKQKYGADEFVEKPFQLAKLMDLVAGFIGEGEIIKPEAESLEESEEQDVTEAPAAPQKVVTLEGELTTVSFPELLHDLYVMASSGYLTMSRENVKKVVTIKDGYPVSVQTNMEEEYFGNFLVRMHCITKEQCEESVYRMKNKKRLIGTILIEMGILTPVDVVNYLKLQMREKIFEIFSWPEGLYQFEEDHSIVGDISSIEMSTANIIYEGIKSHWGMDRLVRYLTPFQDYFLRKSSNLYYQFQDLDLPPSEQRLVDSVDGTKKLKELIAGSMLDLKRSQQLLAVLLLSEMCETSLVPGVAAEKEFSAEKIDLVPLAKPVAPPPSPKPEPEVKVKPAHAAKPAPPAQPAPEPELEEEKPQPVQGDALAAAVADLEEGKAEEDASIRKKIINMWTRLQNANAFEILGVTKDATEHQIKQAYYKYAKEYHPDRYFGKVGGDLKIKVDEIFEKLTQAKDQLDTEDKVEEYKKFLEGIQPKETDTRIEEVKQVIIAEQAFQSGVQYFKIKKYYRASDAFKKATETNPSEAEYAAFYGWALWHIPLEKDVDPEDKKLNPFDSEGEAQYQARDILNRTIATNPRCEKAYLFMGYIYKTQGLREFAERQFEKALLVNPNCVEALRELRLLKMVNPPQKEKTIFDKVRRVLYKKF